MGSKMGIGQHRGDGTGAPNSGQRDIRGTTGDVGQPSGGELNNGPAPAAAPDSMINTTHGAAENDDDHANRYGKR
jgi:hypothetical protein